MSLRTLLLALSVPVLVGAALTGCAPVAAHGAARTASVPASVPASLPASGAAATDGAHRITVDGRERSYRVHRPAGSAPAGGWPLLVFLHGGFGSGAEAERYYGWDAVADRSRAIVAYPDGLGRAWNGGGGCCGAPGRQGVDDVAFLRAMVTAIGADVRLDTRRIYGSGISNGGLLAYRVACDSDLFAAIGVDSTTLTGECPTPRPLSVLHVHGTADRNIPYDGSPGQGVGHVHGAAVEDLIARWRTVDGCPAPRISSAGGVTRSIAECPHGRAVELITIAGAGHQWPGGEHYPGVGRLPGLDVPSSALDATSTIWAFLTAHPRPAPA